MKGALGKLLRVVASKYANFLEPFEHQYGHSLSTYKKGVFNFIVCLQ